MNLIKRIITRQTKPQPQCNYSNNYYGDQVCRLPNQA